ncbi:TPA: translational repressor RegA [Escherichia coli]
MIEIVPGQRTFMKDLTNNFRVISFKQKHEWKLVPKYTIGN